MDIINHYSAYTTARTSTVSQAGTTTQKAGFMSEDEFLDMVKGQSSKSVDDSSRLYNGSTTRAKLSDTEIAVLANKYDVRNMSDEEFDAFLDDLENMGALSDYEKHQLGYRGSVTVGYVRDGKLEGSGVSGMWAAPEVPGGSTKLFNRQDANGDIFRWINDRIQWKRSYSSDPIQRKTEEDYENLHSTLAGIVGRMAVCRVDDAEAERKAGLVRQLADGSSDFYTRMRTMLKAQVEKSREEQQEQDIIDALGKVLDALSGKKDVTGKKVSLNTSANELTRSVNDRIAELKRKNPSDPEIAKLENMLAQLRNAGLYTSMGILDDTQQGEDDSFETLTQLLTRRQTEELISTAHPNQKEVNEPA